jgi:2'-5' RNA ligase
MSPLILTLELDSHSFEIFNALRKEHFPPERNFLDAHLTLFHKLPGEQEESVKETLQEISSRLALKLSFSSLRFLGKSVAINVESPELLDLRKKLATTWKDWLEAQDKQPFKPHVTIQNKVTPEEARKVLEHQVLITKNVPEFTSQFPFQERLLEARARPLCRGH